MELTLLELKNALNTTAYNVSKEVESMPVYIQLDSRKVQDGQIFWALKGKSMDGHEYVEDSFTKGCIGAVVEQSWYSQCEQNVNKPILVVEDSAKSLLELGSIYAQRFTIPFVGITGSNGKTTSKDMLVQVLSSQGEVLGTSGNFNNQIGVPLTLFGLESKHQYAVIEMGTNHPGEIELLSSYVKPDVVLITNIGQSHMEYFKALDNVLQEKWSITRGLKSNGLAVANGEDMYLQKKVAIAKSENTLCQTYGIDRGAWRAENITFDSRGCATFTVLFFEEETAEGHERGTIQLNVPGKHNVLNALGVLSVANYLKVPMTDIIKSLSGFSGSAMRMEVKQVGIYHLLEDCYNANPSSMLSALDVLSMYQKGSRKIAFLGDMAELGDMSEFHHRQIGKQVVSHSVDLLIACGTYAEYYAKGAEEQSMNSEHVHIFPTIEEGIDFLRKVLAPEDVILIKASRSAKLEVVSKFIKEQGIERSRQVEQGEIKR
jgi:UDP-N-acetylmuramoyl-tripeptide--D-alanyl-D-alanine ligase